MPGLLRKNISHRMSLNRGRNEPIHDQFVFIAIRRPANVAELDEDVVLHTGFEIVPTIFFNCGAAEEIFSAALSRLAINNKAAVDV